MFAFTAVGAYRTWVHMVAFLGVCSYSHSEEGYVFRHFPDVEGRNLAGDVVELPAQLAKPHTIIIVAYKRWHQSLVDTWLPRLEVIEDARDDLAVLELPTIAKMNFVSKWWIYHGMRSGITSERARARTVTLHLDKNEFNRHLGIGDEDNIHVFLVDQNGRIRWRTRGVWSEYKQLSFESRLRELTSS